MTHFVPRIFACLTFPFLCFTINAAGEDVRLSSLDLTRVQQGEGKPGVNVSSDGKLLSIAGKKYDHGFGTHAESILQVDIHGGSTRFKAQVGINDEGNPVKQVGSVEFIIEGDGKTLWSSPVMHGGIPAQAVDLDVSGVQLLTLRAGDGFDGTCLLYTSPSPRD